MRRRAVYPYQVNWLIVVHILLDIQDLHRETKQQTPPPRRQGVCPPIWTWSHDPPITLPGTTVEMGGGTITTSDGGSWLTRETLAPGSTPRVVDGVLTGAHGFRTSIGRPQLETLRVQPQVILPSGTGTYNKTWDGLVWLNRSTRRKNNAHLICWENRFPEQRFKKKLFRPTSI